MNHIVIERVSGQAIEPYLSALARLRIEVFRAYPYLYEGTRAYEESYLRSYTADARAVVVIARSTREGSAERERFAGVVGAATALPLSAHSEEELAPALARAGYAPESVFYFGESVLIESERRQGIGHRFFEEREAVAREHGFARVCFCAVERPEGHPARPADYVPHDAFWTRRGFVRHPEICAQFSWRDVGAREQSDKKMVFWLKELAP
jgi:GNAT superfamily N-acetyltransferase